MKRFLHFAYCEVHQKRRYNTRKEARKAQRLHRASKGMREYKCTVAPGWHVGHLPQATVLGQKTAREVYRREKKRQDHHRDHRGGDHPDRCRTDPDWRPAVSAVAMPVKIRIDFADPEADSSEFANCLTEYAAGWLIVTDLTVAGVRKRYAFPVHTIDFVSEESL